MTDDQLALLHEKALEVTAALDEQAATGDPPKYFVTISRRAGHRRLHLSGCFVKPSNCCEVRLFQTVTNEDFDSVCRACRKRCCQRVERMLQKNPAPQRLLRRPLAAKS